MPEEATTTTAYVTAEEATAYFATRLHAEAWAALSADDKPKALGMATRVIDRQLLKGRKTDSAQALAFPRYPDTEVPETVKDACCEEALALLERGDNQRRKLQAEGVTSITIGSLSETYAQGAGGGGSGGGAAGRGLLSLEARELLSPWLLGAVNIT